MIGASSKRYLTRPGQSGMRRPAVSTFPVLNATGTYLVSSRTSVLEEAVANIFRDEPDAGRNIFETDDVVRLDLSDGAGDILSVGADNLSRDLNDPQSSATRPKKPYEKEAAPAQTTTPKPSRIAKTTRKKRP
ncbi:hypothetical protein E4U60_007383 [Claviceps pazoutovae]|uniref:Uncharacterized protein n=1 Tax=Claviceps pazoutovae TaxID=1649127 RepID=A0A9P7SIT7_9HYPO|nr:hypothetical protein E4U60_007383 [Claviceps pazoutovae]